MIRRWYYLWHSLGEFVYRRSDDITIIVAVLDNTGGFVRFATLVWGAMYRRGDNLTFAIIVIDNSGIVRLETFASGCHDFACVTDV